MYLKQVLLFLSILSGLYHINAQVVLASQPLELKKSPGYHTSMMAADADNKNLVVYAADKENLKALHYNRVLFFMDSLSTKRPDDKYEVTAGYSFGEDGAAHIYWATPDYNDIQAVGFDFTNKTVTSADFHLSFKNEDIISAFSDNNSFYILSLSAEKESKNQLKFYIFNGDKYEFKTVDLSSVTFLSTANKSLTLNSLIENYGLQKIETNGFTGLPEASQKIKFYIVEGKMIITADYNETATHLLTINLHDFAVTQETMQQVKFDEEGKANSYIHNGKLYQLKLNSQQLSLSIADIVSGETLKTYTAKATDSISFRNSDLIYQTGSQRPSVFKNAKKFMQRAASSDVALSVYQTPDELLLTIGGVRMVLNAGDAILSAALIAAGASGDMADGLFDPQHTQLVYFESLFDENFEHVNLKPGRLAVDYLSAFSASVKNMALQNVIPFNDYLVLGYYDSKAKQYILRKFSDDDY